MDKNEEFDLDFDFEKEYGFSPETIMDPEYEDDDMDFSDSFLSEDAAPEEPASEDTEPAFAQNSLASEPLLNIPGEETVPAGPSDPTDDGGSGKSDPSDAPPPRPQRRRKSKLRQFKEVYLPAIIAGVALILILIFIIGSISRAISKGKEDDESSKSSSESLDSEAQKLQEEAERIMAEAAALAAGYDYEAAIEKLDSFGELSAYAELLSAKAGYSQQITQLVEWNDPSKIANLSFHVLIADPSRAFTDETYGKKYNMNFVTIDEFSKILEQLYENGYVLVDLDDVVLATTSEDGTVTYSANSIYLPEGKTPIMITETLVNYLYYMIDSDSDGKADAGGDGFASKLVLENGEIKAEMVTSSGETVRGNYDLVPILNSFIQAHPDFSYRGARAMLAVCGYQGIFGYRIQDGNADEIAAAKEVVQALRDEGYTIACYTYGNENYGGINATAIQSDLQKWTEKITPVLGNVDILVFAQGSDISEYTGNKYNVLYSSGFRYFISSATKPWADVSSNYFRQRRLMVTGTQMSYSSSMFSAYFDAKSILDEQRGTVPN